MGPATGCSTGCSTVNGVLNGLLNGTVNGLLNGLLNGTLYALRSRQASRCWDAITWPINKITQWRLRHTRSLCGLTMGTDRRVVIDQVCRRRCIQRQLAEFVPEDCLYTSYPFWLSATLCDHFCYLVMRERQHGLHEERKVRRLQLVADRSTRGLVLFAGHVRSAKIPKDLTVGLQFDTETAQRWKRI